MLTAQDENLVRKGERFVFCEHCSRIHYWQESEALEGTAVATKHTPPPHNCKRHNIICVWEDRQSLSLMAREESLDFIGEDTSERLGAVRLRKV